MTVCAPPQSSPAQVNASQLTTLGTLRLEAAPQFRRLKPLHLLTYLALEGPTPRRQLETLLWPDRPDAANNLRVAVHALRHLSPDLVQGHDRLSTTVRTDVHQALSLRERDAEQIPPAAFLSAGTLKGAAPEFQSWAARVQGRLDRHVRSELVKAALTGIPGYAPDLVARLWTMPEPLTPDELRLLLPLTEPGSALHGQLRAALLTDPAHTDRRAQRPEVLTGGARRDDLTNLIGRAQELTLLHHWGTQQGGGVALISGLPGIGKTALARAALHTLPALGRCCLSTDLTGLTGRGEFLIHWSAALLPGRPVQGWAALRPALGLNPLVLLDHADQCADLPGLLAELRQDLPDVRWLVTSRVTPEPALPPCTLHLRLSGLPCPAPGDAGDRVVASPAVRLFLHQAAASGVTLTRQAGTDEALARVTRAVAGHPLGLRLAASHLPRLPLPALGALLSTSSPSPVGEVLHATLMRDTWNALDAGARRAARHLTALQDFTPDAAQANGIALPTLHALDRHALLERAGTPGGAAQYRLHPLVRAYVLTLPPQGGTDAPGANPEPSPRSA